MYKEGKKLPEEMRLTTDASEPVFDSRPWQGFLCLVLCFVVVVVLLF